MDQFSTPIPEVKTLKCVPTILIIQKTSKTLKKTKKTKYEFWTKIQNRLKKWNLIKKNALGIFRFVIFEGAPKNMSGTEMIKNQRKTAHNDIPPNIAITQQPIGTNWCKTINNILNNNIIYNSWINIEQSIIYSGIIKLIIMWSILWCRNIWIWFSLWCIENSTVDDWFSVVETAVCGFALKRWIVNWPAQNTY